MPSLPLTKATGLNCKKIGGVKALYAIKTSGISSMVAGATDHDITNIVFVNSGDGFGKVEFKRNQCEITETAELMNSVNVIFSVPNPDAVQRGQLQAIKDSCESILVAELYDDERLLVVGWDAKAGFEAFASHDTTESTSGVAKDDENLFTMTLMAEHQEYLRVLTEISGASATTVPAILAELIAATSV